MKVSVTGTRIGRKLSLGNNVYADFKCNVLYPRRARTLRDFASTRKK